MKPPWSARLPPAPGGGRLLDGANYLPHYFTHMPATFAHPAAVLPFRWLPGRGLDFAALVIGSVAPDFGYYVQRFDLATYAHCLRGSLLVALPLGVVAYAVFRSTRAAVCYLLPEPHRSALLPLASQRFRLKATTFFRAAISLLLGAWTHCAWDAFTHKTGWVVQRIDVLRETVLHVGPAELPAYHVLQHLSTAAGTALLVFAYLSWLRRQPRATVPSAGVLTDRRRYLLLALLTIVAVGAGIGLAAIDAQRFSGYLMVRVLLFRTAIYSTAVFVPLFLSTAAVVHLFRKAKG